MNHTIPTSVETAEFERYAAERAHDARMARELAILTLARPQMKRLDVADLEALCELAEDEDGLTLAEMILNPALSPLREAPSDDIDLALFLRIRAEIELREEPA